MAEPVATITGIAGVRDGDGILFGKVEIRLQGIASPEDGDTGGGEASAHLRALADGKRVICELDGTVTGDRSHRRPVGVCRIDGSDLGFLQVEGGFARDCPRYSAGRYAEAERRAQAKGRNLSAFYPLPNYCLR